MAEVIIPQQDSAPYSTILDTLAAETPLTPTFTVQKHTNPRYSVRVFENAIRTPEKLDKAIEVAKKNHCAEDLLLFKAIIAWEKAPKADKAEAAEAILHEFIEVNSLNEVCISAAIRNKLLKRSQPMDVPDFFDELKTLMINEVRLMGVIADFLLR